ncbi:hypothetical protein QWY28_03835 [Nocardioides sp. SOB77]|uniref:Uncharacterized protein n=1 Tax=Nocardioides oceani TaxID=3058369 RepID=A0ABT8FCB4_9ACTN|nr:hypothetical protein [Nocardioides oceani]MDN4172065.1 hypothetical protein [Nocardioides oceani]
MNFARKVGITFAAAAVSFGLLAVSAPAAQADTTWGYRIAPTAGR